MKLTLPLTLIFLLGLLACNSTEEETPKPGSNNNTQDSISMEQDSIVLSFTFVGCNRVDRTDQDNPEATNASSANLYVLKRIYREICSSQRKPELFFFLGDLVYAESTTERLNSQLQAWVELYHDTLFSQISNSGIELVAIPGNHEMLSYHDYGIPGHDEWPLKGATELWMKYMSDYMPEDRDYVTGPDSIVNQMTFSFIRENVGFVLMNTDTYNAPCEEHPHGMEGLIPTDWIVNKVNEYQNNPEIDHVFVLGHKPYYVNGQPETGHTGLPEGPILWPKLNDAHVIAMLSAHLHDYQRVQPGDEGTYQIIAGNGGSSGTAEFFGYSTINIWSNGEVELISKGFDKGDPYYKAVPQNPTTVRDSTHLTWSKNANPYSN